jgi:hypothetical protein
MEFEVSSSKIHGPPSPGSFIQLRRTAFPKLHYRILGEEVHLQLAEIDEAC